MLAPILSASRAVCAAGLILPERPGCADAHRNSSFSAPINCGTADRGRADTARAYTPPITPGRIAHGFGESLVAGLPSDQRTREPPPRRCPTCGSSCERVDPEGVPKDWPSCPSTQGTCGIGSDLRILMISVPVSTPVESLLYQARGQSKASTAAPDGDSLCTEASPPAVEWLPRTDPPDDFKSRQMEVFITTVEESSQQRQRSTRTLN